MDIATLQNLGPYIWEFALAVIFTAIGAIYSKNQVGKREKKRVLEELTHIQREMYGRATKNWSEHGAREVWMIGLYFERVETLQAMLDDRDGLPPNTSQLFESYAVSLRQFGNIWAASQRRGDTFKEAYQKTFSLYHNLIRTLSKEYVIDNRPVIDLLRNTEP